MFQAFLNKQFTDYTTDDKVFYPHVIKNEGSGYNSSTSTFTAPISGLYAFAKQTCTSRTGSAVTSFIMNGVRILDTQTTAPVDENACSSGQVFVQMNKGDQMWVVVPFSVTHIMSARFHQSSFAGAFLHP